MKFSKELITKIITPSNNMFNKCQTSNLISRKNKKDVIDILIL